MAKGWHRESARHSLAARGMKTRCKAPSKHLELSGYGEVIRASPEEWKEKLHDVLIDFNNSFGESHSKYGQLSSEAELEDRNEYYGRSLGVEKARDIMLLLFNDTEDWDSVKWKMMAKRFRDDLQYRYDLYDREYETALERHYSRAEWKLLKGRRDGMSRAKDLVEHYMIQWSR